MPYGQQQGLSAASAANLVASISGAAFGGKLVSGYLCDKIDKRWLSSTIVLLTVIFMLVLHSQPSYPILLAACGTAGLAIGATMPVWYASVAQCFGSQSYGKALGVTAAIHMPFGLTAVRFAGEVYDRTGGYELMFLTFAVAAVVGGLLLLPVSLPPPLLAARKRAALAQQVASAAAAIP